MRRSCLALALLCGAAPACFTDQPTGGGQDTDTTGGQCAIGSLGCVCTEGNACDAGLECVLPASMCAEPNCTPGEGLCECNAMMMCEPNFVCVQNYCEPVDTGSSGVESDPGSTGSGVLPDTDTTGVSGTNEVGTDTGTTFSSASQGTMMDPSTTESPTCMQCLDAAQSGECSGEWGTCTNCEQIFDCFAMARSLTCCADYVPPAIWDVFAGCAAHCDSACGTLACG